MFEKAKKARAIEALHRGIKAILVGGFFHIEHAEQFGLNEEASAWLYTEAIAHQVYMLNAIFSNTLGKKHQWATLDFMVKAMSEAMTEFELEHKQIPGGTASFTFRRCAEIDALTPAERLAGKQFVQSAERIAQLDPSADAAAIADRLAAASKEYFNEALPMFR